MPRSVNAVLDDMAVAAIEITAEDVADIDSDDEVVRVVEASVDDREKGNDELVAGAGINSGVEAAEVEEMEVADTGEVQLNESKKFNEKEILRAQN